ncbi:MAG: SH3 domain-containing protein [Parachlamydiaceae bacterium]
MQPFKTILATALLLQTPVICDESNSSTDLPRIEIQTSFSPFTGRATKSKVRMRAQPSLDAQVVRELSKGELLIVTGETEEFYAVEPPSDIKGYVFRTFILDNKVEGNRVNVRLTPSTDAPVIGQLNHGEPVDGTISPLNNKWLEIAPPSNSKFYVAKEYMEKVGDPNYMAKIAKRRDEVNALLNSTYLISQQEFQKSFPEINLDRIQGNYQQIVREYSDFPEQSGRAKELLAELQENYVKAKIAYLEAKVKETPITTTTRNEPVAVATQPNYPEVLTHVNYWLPQEESIYAAWSNDNQGTIEEFYAVQSNEGQTVTGVLEPYSRTIKNKPGDFMLVDKATHQPLAFLYSTKLNLQNYVGREVTFLVSSRPNHNFAYPAYFVISTQ